MKIKNNFLKTWSFPTSWIIQAVVNPIQFLRASRNFTARKIFKFQFKYEQILHALGVYKKVENLKTWSFSTSWIIQAVFNTVKFLRAIATLKPDCNDMFVQGGSCSFVFG